MIVRIDHYPSIAGLTSSFVMVFVLPLIFGSLAAAEPAFDEGKAVQPSLGIHFAFDSNIYDTNANPTESWIGILTPAILLSTVPAQQHYALLYQGEYGYFFENSADNYADHMLAGRAKFLLSSRAQLELAAAAAKQHYDRGTYQTQGLDPTSPSFPSTPDEFDRKNWGGKFRYGADGNRGRLRIGFGGSQRDYTNNRERTQFYDYEALSGSAGLSLFFHQRTAIVFDAVFTDINYETDRPGEPSLDSEDWRFLVGLTWEATVKTSGSAQFGVERRRFDDPARAPTSNPSWDINVRWSPREYSYLNFAASRRNEETFDVGAFIDVSQYKVTWTHQWRQAWEATLSWATNKDEFVGASQEQKFDELSVGLRYRQRRLLAWEAGYARRSRDSSSTDLIYDGDMFRIGVNLGN